MACDVDELDINPFFKALQTRFLDLYNHAQEKCYTICIPQSSSIQDTAISTDFAETHILKPSPYFKGELMTIHSGCCKTLTLAPDGCSITTADGFQYKLIVRVISEELAYNKEYNQFKILILDQPLDPKFQSQTGSDDGNRTQKRPVQCITLEDCKRFLKSIAAFSKTLDKVDQGLRVFNASYMVLPDYLPEAASRLADISAEAVENCMKCLKKQQRNDVYWTDALVVSMESYVMSSVHQKVFGVVTSRCGADDGTVLHKRQQQLMTISPEALGVERRFACPLPNAVNELNRLDTLCTPREKLHCLKSAVDAVTSGIKAHLTSDIPPHLALIAEKPCLTSDDLIPILVHVIGQSNCQHLPSDIFYMETFAWASSAKDLDDLSYCLVTFNAAVHYILTTDFSKMAQKSFDKKQMQNNVDRISSRTDRLSLTNGSGKGDKSASPRLSPNPFSSGAFDYSNASPRVSPNHFSPKAAAGPVPSHALLPSSDRLERQMSRITKALDETTYPQGKKEDEKSKVKSIFGSQYDAPVPLKIDQQPKPAPQLGDFLSSLQDDFLDQPFGKQA